MKLLTYEVERRTLIGVMSKDDQWVFPISSLGMDYKTMLEVVVGMSVSEKQLLEHISGLEPYSIKGAARMNEITVKAPIPAPEQDIICLGMNYMDHAEESARFNNEAFTEERPKAVYFSKRVNCAVADGEDIPCHSDIVDSLDYEAELAVIIGKDARRVKPEHVKDYIFGYTIINDVSARNIQTEHIQWYFGKSLDGFTPMGPCIMTVDSCDYPPQLEVTSKVNGELRQNSNTGNLIYGLDHIISELSMGMTLKAGTIISTGTPAGVGMGFEPPKFLQPGDVVECSIEGIGTITNKVV